MTIAASLPEVAGHFGVSAETAERWRAAGCPALAQAPYDLDGIARWREELLIGSSPPQLELEIRRLERDKQLEEIKQLRTSRTTQWITPAALATLVPLLAGLAVWIFAELKQLNAGYRALEDVKSLKEERSALEARKNGLNLEVTALLAQKADYQAQAAQLKAEAAQLRAETIARQDELDRLYLRAKFAAAETTYALTHIRGLGRGPTRDRLRAIKTDLKTLPAEAAATVNDMIDIYEFAMEIVDITEETLQPLTKAVESIPASDWTHQLRPMPSGAIIPNRSVMESGDGKQYYDVEAGRFLTPEEIKKANNPAPE